MVTMLEVLECRDHCEDWPRVDDISISDVGVQIVVGTVAEAPHGTYEPGCSLWEFLLGWVERVLGLSRIGLRLVRVDLRPFECQLSFKPEAV